MRTTYLFLFFQCIVFNFKMLLFVFSNLVLLLESESLTCPSINGGSQWNRGTTFMISDYNLFPFTRYMQWENSEEKEKKKKKSKEEKKKKDMKWGKDSTQNSVCLTEEIPPRARKLSSSSSDISLELLPALDHEAHQQSSLHTAALHSHSSIKQLWK